MDFICSVITEIDLPKGMKPPGTVEDDEAADEKAKDAEDWTDLSLEVFLKE